MFYHGYDNYMKHAFPEDELRPISCKPLTRDRANPAHIELNDALGNYSLTLIDSLSTLAILASSPTTAGGQNKALKYFKTSVAALIEQYGDGSAGPEGKGLRSRGFDLDSKVQVFETVIRGVGGLLSAHLFAVGDLPIRGYNPRHQSGNRPVNSGRGSERIRWSRSFTYDGQLLRLAQDLANRLVPAFHTATGLPYPRVNLRHGIPFYLNSPLNNNAEDGQCQPIQQPIGELTETCSAGAGSLVLEFTTLSRLTGDSRYEQLAKKAFWSVWERRSTLGLIGSGIDAETGLWTSPFTGIGAGIDSFYEYAAKSYVLLSGSPSPSDSDTFHAPDSPTLSFLPALSKEQQMAESFLEVWQTSHSAINHHLRRGSSYIHPHYIQGDLYTGAARAFWFDSLSAFYPGLLAMTGDLEEATEIHLLFTAIWTRYSALPERWSTSSGSVEGGLGWWGGRPEFIESTYHLYRATRDPWYLHVGEMVLRDIKRRCWTKCGWAGIQDVRSGERSDRMESFFLGETTKYLFLLFDTEHPLNKLDAPFVFSTEGHPLILPRKDKTQRSRPQSDPSNYYTAEEMQDMISEADCPVPPATIPFSLSATAARNNIFHAANLARLHLMPTPENLESPIVEYSSDHPSISLADVRSPSNYTYFPWTLPLELVPYNGVSSKIVARPTFDITFPPLPNMVNLGPGVLQRIGNGILINSMGGVRLGMIQDVPIASDDGASRGDLFRVQAINNVLLGKDERIFLAKDVASSVVNPLDPNFTRVRDASMLDLVIDVVPALTKQINTTKPDTLSFTMDSKSLAKLEPIAEQEADAASSMRLALNSLIQHVTSLLHDPPSPTAQPLHRHYVPAITPTGAGAAPLPDIEEALGPDINGGPQGPLLWHSIHVAGENCHKRLPAHIPRENQVLVLKRGGCSFSQKLENIPTFAPSKTSLQLVIVVSYEEDEGDVPQGWLIRPLLDKKQETSSGLPRYRPIPMVMVGGGEEVYGGFERARGVGVKRRYSVQAQGVPISNLIII